MFAYFSSKFFAWRNYVWTWFNQTVFTVQLADKSRFVNVIPKMTAYSFNHTILTTNSFEWVEQDLVHWIIEMHSWWLEAPLHLAQYDAVNCSTLDHSFASLTCLVDMPSVLLVPIAWWCHLSSFPLLVVGPFQWPVLRSGMVYRRKLRLCSRCRFFANGLKLFCFGFRFSLPDCSFLV